ERQAQLTTNARTAFKRLVNSRKHLQKYRMRVESFTGTIDRKGAATGPYVVRERFEDHRTVDVPLTVHLLHDARLAASRRVEQCGVHGWKCGQEASFRGTIERDTERTVAWLCQRAGVNRWISVELNSGEG